ncbi:hypothetical protein [Agrococcus baldri]|uniref:Uncharacterized protein n=1 Tax=Agrococcus baldri TaxID=153730 RepID=A0AA87RBY6_9MICO|nr:hypothetical protein [Agrococcus baldri]GEK80300.1 hypothetical protein ABA31_16510 [Agrococcus baldri]
MSSASPRPSARPTGRGLGLPHLAVIGLSLLAVPRVVLHDLGLVAPGTAANLLLVVAPIAIWIAVVLLRRVPSPFLTLLVTGAWYGVFLGIGHQLLWDASFAGAPPQLAGSLAGIDPVLEAVIVRTFAAGSSLITGVIVGAVSGLVALGIRAVASRSAR